MNVVICDDDRDYLNQAEKILRDYLNQKVTDVDIESFTNGKDLFQYLEQEPKQVHLLFMDIELNQENGIDLVEQINRQYPWCIVVFLTNYINYATSVYSVKHSYFVLKEELEQRLPELFRVLFHLNHENRILMVNWRGKTTLFKLYEVNYIERSRRGSYVITAEGRFQTSMRFTELEEQLRDTSFIQVHNSFWVNGTSVRSFDGSEVVLKDGTVIPISRRYKSSARDAFYQIQEALI